MALGIEGNLLPASLTDSCCCALCELANSYEGGGVCGRIMVGGVYEGGGVMGGAYGGGRKAFEGTDS